jgi:hypothetical protein
VRRRPRDAGQGAGCEPSERIASHIGSGAALLAPLPGTPDRRHLARTRPTRTTKAQALSHQVSGSKDRGLPLGSANYPVEDERRFAQTAGNRLLMPGALCFAGVRVKRDAAAVQQMAEVGRKHVDRYVEPHVIGRPGVAESIKSDSSADGSRSSPGQRWPPFSPFAVKYQSAAWLISQTLSPEAAAMGVGPMLQPMATRAAYTLHAE